MKTLDDNLTLPGVDKLKFFVLVGAGVLVILFLTLGSCAMHSNTFDQERTMAEAELERARGDHTKAANEVRMEQVKAIERLVATGVDPIAARCAVMSWDSHTRPTCDRISK